MSHEPKGIERRQSVRIKKHYIIRFFKKGDPSVEYEISQIENISKGGLCFTSTQVFDEGTLLSMELRTPFIADTILLEGVILEVQEKVRGMIYQNRLQFQDVEPRAIDVLDKIEKYSTKDDAQ